MKLTKPGQIAIGDTVSCKYKGNHEQYTVQEILNPGSTEEEIIINTQQNKYFITSMAIQGSSWAKDVNIKKTSKP